MLQYPWLYPMPGRGAERPQLLRSEDRPGRPVDERRDQLDRQLGARHPGLLQLSSTPCGATEPFIRDVFDQFSETSTGGAFTFMTGIGGFLQEFLYGYRGLRWEASDVRLAPSLTRQLQRVVLHNLSWQGRVFTVSIGRRFTFVTLQSGGPLPVRTLRGLRMVTAAHALTIATARPDLRRTSDAVRCQPAKASNAEPGSPALAAIDGNPATDWQPARLPATFTTPLRAGHQIIGRVTVIWGRLWPGVKQPNVPPAPRPVKTLRASSYTVQVSLNGRTWRTVARVRGVTKRISDVLRFGPVRARFIRLRLTKGGQKPLRPD